MGICHKNGANSSMIPCHFFNLKKKQKNKKKKEKPLRDMHTRKGKWTTQKAIILYFMYIVSVDQTILLPTYVRHSRNHID